MIFSNFIYNRKYGKIIASALRNGHKVYIGKTHADCFTQERVGVLRNAEQGFITANYKFVDRKTALKIAKHYKQIKHKHPPKDILMSEDII